jgi:hypothetical protein
MKITVLMMNFSFIVPIVNDFGKVTDQSETHYFHMPMDW